MRVRSMRWDHPLEEGMATHSSILAWRQEDRGAWWVTVHRVAKSQTQLKQHSMHAHTSPPYQHIHLKELRFFYF